MSRQEAMHDVRKEVAEMDERRHLPEGEAPAQSVMKREALVVALLAGVGVIIVAVAAYLLNGWPATLAALGLMFVLISFAAMPAWIASLQRAKVDDEVEARAEKRVEREEYHEHAGY